MDDTRFDRFARALARPANRRGVLALAGGLVASRVRAATAAPAAQAGPSTCGAAGDVCTMLLGCCSGMTCVTSAINVNYGVCVSGGDGGTVAAGTGLISPFSDTLEQEIGTLTVPETTTTFDPEAEREERKAARAARKNRKESRRNSRRSERDVRRDNQRDDKELRRGPKLDVALFNRGGGEDSLETVRVENRDDSSVLLTRIESLLDPSDNSSVSETLSVGDVFNFYSGPVAEPIDDEDELSWINQPICDGTEGAGFRVHVGFSSSSENREYEIYCNSADDPADQNGGGRKRKKRRKRKRKQDNKQRRKKRNK